MDTRYLKARIRECLLANTAIDFDSIFLQTDLSIDHYVDALYSFINLKAIVNSNFNIVFFFDFQPELIRLRRIEFKDRLILLNVEYTNPVTKRKHKIKYKFMFTDFMYYPHEFKATIISDNDEEFIIENDDAEICEFGNHVMCSEATTIFELSPTKQIDHLW